MAHKTSVLTTAGFSPPFFLESPFRLIQSLPGQAAVVSQLLPLFIVNLSPGAVLTYNIEITGMHTQGTEAGNYPVSEPWNVADNASQLTANINYPVNSMVVAFRINITAYTSGTLTASLVQP